MATSVATPAAPVGLASIAEVRLGVAGLAVLALTAGLHLAHATAPVVLVAHGGLLVVAARGLPLRLALLLGLASWGFVTGFGVNELGELSLAGADLARLLLLTTLAGMAAMRQGSAPAASGRRQGPSTSADPGVH